ncbi:hypothetical protein EVAR_101826_1 [Eumeta japonica]|uniref:Uncharacterized protein n=1 Tax=Eumeta variegata TaxID=151549 RepID=A0A4C1SQZ1_EUMVA|nr:hypothetical protein EVAR_101826_1 [Eumeta japonica]
MKCLRKTVLDVDKRRRTPNANVAPARSVLRTRIWHRAPRFAPGPSRYNRGRQFCAIYSYSSMILCLVWLREDACVRSLRLYTIRDPVPRFTVVSPFSALRPPLLAKHPRPSFPGLWARGALQEF